VVCLSPLLGIAKYEKEHGIPHNYLNCSIVERGSNGAWQKFERGEIPLLEFYLAFGRDLSDTVNGHKWYKEYCERKGIACPQLPERLSIDGRELFGAMMRGANAYDTHIRLAIEHLRRKTQYKLIALTNNFSSIHMPPSELSFLGYEKGGATPPHLRNLFDDFCDSSELGMRKPDPSFFLLACSRNNVRPEEVVFLDDIGINVKAARELGMHTIHVRIGKTLQAVKQLEEKLGLDLTSPLDILGPETTSKL